LIVVGTVTPGERPRGGSGVGELPTYCRFFGGDTGDERRTRDFGRVLGNLGEKVACAGSEVVGENDVGGADGVFKPPKFCDRTAHDGRRCGLVSTLALDTNKFAGLGIDRGFAGVGTRFDRRGEREGEISQRVGRGDGGDADA